MAEPDADEPSEQAETGQHVTRGLGDGLGAHLGVEEVVHHNDVVVGVAEDAVGGDRVRAGDDLDSADPFARVGYGARKVSPWLPPTRASRLKIRLLLASKNSTVVRFATSTSTKITPKALVVPATVVPGRKKLTSVILLFTAVNSRWQLKVWKSFGKPNNGGVAPPALALTRKPEPGVLSTMPRGEVVLKKFAGNRLGSERASGTPSQLTSRRSPPKEPLGPATVPPPTAARKVSRVGVIAAALAPVASKTTKPACAEVVVIAQASETITALARIFAGGGWQPEQTA